MSLQFLSTVVNLSNFTIGLNTKIEIELTHLVTEEESANLRPSSGIWLMMSGEEKIGSK